MTSRLTCMLDGTMNPMTRWAHPRLHQMHWPTVEKLFRNMTKYSIPTRKTVRGAVLDLPSKVNQVRQVLQRV